VSINGISAESFPIAAREQMAFIASGEGGFYESLSMQDNLLFFGRMRNVRDTLLKERIRELAGRLGILEWLAAPVSHCSSGIRRKASILRSALAKPSVYIIDEFSESLDDRSRESVCEYLREEISGGCACLVVSNGPLDGKMLNAAMYRLEDGVIKSI
jgi:ABC-type multidrug transport system ATPase subunit